MFLPPALVLLVLSKFLAEHVTGQFRLLIVVAPCWVEASWLSTILNMLIDIPHCCAILTNFCHGCFGRLGAEGSAIAAFNPLATEGLLLHIQGLCSSLC